MKCLAAILLFALMLCNNVAAQDSKITAPNINNVLYVDGQTYTTLGAAFAHCASGCTIDMRGNSNAAALALGTFDPGSSANPVTILLGPFNYTLTQMTSRTGLQVIGMGSGATTITQGNADMAPFILPQSGGYPAVVAQHVLLQGFSLQAAAGSTTDAISMVGASIGGLWYSAFYDLTIGSATQFGRNAMRFDSTAEGSPPATDQFISIRNVVCYRALNAPPALMIRGEYTGQFSIDDAEFDGNYNHGTLETGSNNYNIEISDGRNSYLPYSINMHNVTSQWAWGTGSAAIYVNGASNVLCQGCHFEGDNGVIKEARGPGKHGNWGVTITDSYIAGNTGINGGKGFLASLDSSSGLTFTNNTIFSTPNAFFIGVGAKYVTSYANFNPYGGLWQPLSQIPFLNILDSGTCTMSGGTCGTQTLTSHTYATAPKCFLTWTGAGTFTGIAKCSSTTTTVTPGSSVGTDSAVVNWFVLGQ
jgi:hypothetical protein